MGIPFPVHAGVFSFVSNLFSSEEEMTGAVINSQNIELLKAPISSDSGSSRGGGDITIVGGSALLAENGPSGTSADIEESKSSDEISIYIVHEGDSLGGIAKMYGVSINTIIWANDLPNTIIKEGQKLIILPITGIKHTVKKGDTVESIAKKYKADAEEIRQFNNLGSKGSLAVGEDIIVPDAELALTPKAVSGGAKVRGTGGPLYEGYYKSPIAIYKKSQGPHGYNGVDLAAPSGTPVMASASGEVIISRNYGWNGGYGNYIVIEHGNGTQTLYSHLLSNSVFEGYHVVKGQVIGYVGSTGKSTGPHLHFEVRGAKNPF